MNEIKTEIIELELLKIKDFPNNPQNVPPEKMKKMTSYMKKFGWIGQMPLAWLCKDDDKTYWISGHHRARAAINAGIKHRNAEVIVDDRYNWDQAVKDVLMYNNIHGNPDVELENEIIREIMKTQDIELDEIANAIGLSEKQLSKRIMDDMKIDLSDDIGNTHEVVIECRDVEEQKEVYEKLNSEGYKCRLLTL